MKSSPRSTGVKHTHSPLTLILSSSLLISCLVWPALSAGLPSPDDCEPKDCGRGPSISYPFWIDGRQPSYCGYPAFKLTCKDGVPVVNIYDDDYHVHDIFYNNRSFIVSSIGLDGSRCPVPSYNLSLVATPFSVNSVNRNLYFFLDCKETVPGYQIDCAADVNGTLYVVGNQSSLDQGKAMETCESFVMWPSRGNGSAEVDRNYAGLLADGFVLSWDAVDCSVCKESGGRCRYDLTQSRFSCVCSDRPHAVSCNGSALYPVGNRKKKKIQSLVITFATLGALMISLGCLGVFLKRKCGRKGERKKTGALVYRDMKFPSMLPGGENVADPPLLHFSGVLAATDYFSPANKLGEGGFGPVYKGRLPNGDMVAVKRLSKCSGQGLLEFRNEVELIARLQHKNIVQLLGWCLHEDEKILIYEYLPNRSLDKFIFDPSRAIELDWEKRFHIIKGIAQGLLYLHQHSRLHIVHRDLKTSNILLDAAMNAKISDFGLARMFRGSQEEANTDRIVGTYGYMSPEYVLDGHFSEKSDVFSFGVILLEIVSGRRNTGFYPYKESMTLLGHAWKLWNEGRGLELLDTSLGDSCPREVVSRCIHVSLICVQEVAAARPTTSEIVGMLGAEINASLPTPRQPAFFIEQDFSHGGVPTIGSINFLTNSSVVSR